MWYLTRMFTLRRDTTRDGRTAHVGERYRLHSRLCDPNDTVTVIGLAKGAPSWLDGEPVPILVVEDTAGNTMRCEPWQLSVLHPFELGQFLRHPHLPAFPPRLRLVTSG